LKQKLVERVHIHDGDLSAFYEEFPKKYLPEELGGTCAYDNKLWMCELLEPEQTEQDTKYHTSAHIQSLGSTTQQHQQQGTNSTSSFFKFSY